MKLIILELFRPKRAFIISGIKKSIYAHTYFMKILLIMQVS